ncbi:hypothetical protein V6Z11_D04G072000 [Gossypium hirsutum]
MSLKIPECSRWLEEWCIIEPYQPAKKLLCQLQHLAMYSDSDVSGTDILKVFQDFHVLRVFLLENHALNMIMGTKTSTKMKTRSNRGILLEIYIANKKQQKKKGYLPHWFSHGNYA